MVFLPPYSPDFSSIKRVFAKFTAVLRSAHKRAVEVVWRSSGGLMQAFSPNNRAN